VPPVCLVKIPDITILTANTTRATEYTYLIMRTRQSISLSRWLASYYYYQRGSSLLLLLIIIINEARASHYSTLSTVLRRTPKTNKKERRDNEEAKVSKYDEWWANFIRLTVIMTVPTLELWTSPLRLLPVPFCVNELCLHVRWAVCVSNELCL
jgi:hypothetical protein